VYAFKSPAGISTVVDIVRSTGVQPQAANVLQERGATLRFLPCARACRFLHPDLRFFFLEEG
jgi:hypothetical protein